VSQLLRILEEIQKLKGISETAQLLTMARSGADQLL
jgi:hypothetical protein